MTACEYISDEDDMIASSSKRPRSSTPDMVDFLLPVVPPPGIVGIFRESFEKEHQEMVEYSTKLREAHGRMYTRMGMAMQAECDVLKVQIEDLQKQLLDRDKKLEEHRERSEELEKLRKEHAVEIQYVVLVVLYDHRNSS
jgi:hypothetical protein